MEAARERSVLGDKRTRLHPVPGSKYGVWIIETVLACLNCHGFFWSWDVRQNRICPGCKGDPEYQYWTQLIEHDPSFLYDNLLESDMDEALTDGLTRSNLKSHWETDKEKQGKPIKCPECGEIVYRPGTADRHPCFVHHLNGIEQRARDIERHYFGEQYRIPSRGYYARDGHALYGPRGDEDDGEELG